MPGHVVILGCGRSGTSIFGELFDHLAGYTYHSEPLFATMLAFDFSTPIAVKVPKESAGYAPTPGLSFPLGQMVSDIPDPKRFYWQVRHPLDTICSLRVGIAKNWGHHPKPPDWQDWLKRPLLERCAHHWAYLNSVGYAHVRHLATVTRFEEMIREPQRFAASICKDVGIDPAEQEAEIAGWAQRVQNTNNADFVEAKTSRSYSRPDHTVRISRWKENLSKAEVKSVLPIIEEVAHRFGYLLDEKDSN